MQFTPVWRAVTLISNDCARIKLTCSNSQADSALKNPSPHFSGFEFRRAMTMNVLLFGNAFALINRTIGGEILSLSILDPMTVSLELVGNTPYYRTADYSRVPGSDVLHLRAPSGNALWGESPVQVCKAAIELLASQELMAEQTYLNAANPKIALLHPGKLSAEAMQKVEADYMAKHSGSSNAGRPFIGIEGLKVERISSTVDDSGLQSARSFSIEDVGRIYGIPGLLLGHSDAGNRYGNLEWTQRMYLDTCLQAWLSSWTAEILSKLCGPADSVLFDVDQIIKPGMAETMAALRTATEAGFMTRNEARARLDLDPLPGLDEPTLALNVGTGGGSTNIGADTSQEAGTNENF